MKESTFQEEFFKILLASMLGLGAFGTIVPLVLQEITEALDIKDGEDLHRSFHFFLIIYGAAPMMFFMWLYFAGHNRHKRIVNEENIKHAAAESEHKNCFSFEDLENGTTISLTLSSIVLFALLLCRGGEPSLGNWVSIFIAFGALMAAIVICTFLYKKIEFIKKIKNKIHWIFTGATIIVLLSIIMTSPSKGSKDNRLRSSVFYKMVTLDSLNDTYKNFTMDRKLTVDSAYLRSRMNYRITANHSERRNQLNVYNRLLPLKIKLKNIESRNTSNISYRASLKILCEHLNHVDIEVKRIATTSHSQFVVADLYVWYNDFTAWLQREQSRYQNVLKKEIASEQFEPAQQKLLFLFSISFICLIVIYLILLKRDRKEDDRQRGIVSTFILIYLLLIIPMLRKVDPQKINLSEPYLIMGLPQWYFPAALSSIRQTSIAHQPSSESSPRDEEKIESTFETVVLSKLETANDALEVIKDTTTSLPSKIDTTEKKIKDTMKIIDDQRRREIDSLPQL
ncbi:MAG: hypothetical protein WA960_22505 [Tunicatimonas sp.]